MPRGDGTGPMGAGPMTGRAAGFCAGYPTAGFMQPGGGRGGFGGGAGFGRGGGRGRRNWFYATGVPGLGRGRGWFGPAAGAPASELEVVKREAELLQDSLAQVKERIGKLETE